MDNLLLLLTEIFWFFLSLFKINIFLKLKQLGSPRSSSASRTNTQPNKQEVDMFLANLLVQSATYLVNGSVVVTVAGLVVCFLFFIIVKRPIFYFNNLFKNL